MVTTIGLRLSLCHIEMSPHEKSARGEIITDLIFPFY